MAPHDHGLERHKPPEFLGTFSNYSPGCHSWRKVFDQQLLWHASVDPRLAVGGCRLKPAGLNKPERPLKRIQGSLKQDFPLRQVATRLTLRAEHEVMVTVLVDLHPDRFPVSGDYCSLTTLT